MRCRNVTLVACCAGVVKDWLLIVLSVLLFGSPVSGISLLGYLLAFAGVKYYNNQRVSDMRAAAESKDAAAKRSASEPLLQREGSCASNEVDGTEGTVASS
jgi:hypothetical protein